MLTTSDFLNLTHQFDRFYSQKLGQVALKYQLSKVEIDVLLFLHNNPEFDTARDIAEYRHIAKSYVSKAVEQLVRRGLLSTSEDPHDRRIVHLTILPEAANMIRDAKKAQKEIWAAVSQGITLQEQRVMERIVRKISENLTEKE